MHRVRLRNDGREVEVDEAEFTDLTRLGFVAEELGELAPAEGADQAPTGSGDETASMGRGRRGAETRES